MSASTAGRYGFFFSGVREESTPIHATPSLMRDARRLSPQATSRIGPFSSGATTSWTSCGDSKDSHRSRVAGVVWVDRGHVWDFCTCVSAAERLTKKAQSVPSLPPARLAQRASLPTETSPLRCYRNADSRHGDKIRPSR
jgi:hypothetical protein